ncbi:NitT/TauT family transport system substrate-binding protein [Rhodovulum sp. ES.010]|uniref:ABC transporter substrate-binding protein n=1 Tax=Rhodovulum sp. ES.010 TaxID=1882821 RepID=UPI00092A0A87|nr:PhnD/SsuA/transferrin family substrate-binding protein [Rhodovulum sp. ES.010]SIO25638.1 NitT/TauT family transport system substrate-binding protein [Rhodovulum sp. ES.010]
MSLPYAPLPHRREVLHGLAALSVCGLAPALARTAAQAKSLTLWGIPASPSAVFARAAASDRLQAVSPGARFDIWTSTDQMRAGVASGDFALFAASTYAAANFYNRGAGTRMINVVTWGLLYVMARDDNVRTIGDLAGKTVLLSNRHEAPDLVFRMVLIWAGLDPDRDVRLDYVGSPGEAAPLFLAGRGDVALLHEPAATAALMRAEAEGVPIVRAIDLAEVYGRHTGRGPRIPQVGLAASARLCAEAPELVNAAHAACVEAGAWVRAHPEAAAAATAPLLGLPAAAVANSLRFVRLEVTAARAVRDDIDVYFGNLLALVPGILGHRLPDARFYWG